MRVRHWVTLMALGITAFVGVSHVSAAGGGGGAPPAGLNFFLNDTVNPPVPRKAEIDVVLPRTCQSLSPFLIAAGYSNTADDVRLRAEDLSGWTYFAPTSNNPEIVTLYMDNVSQGTIVPAAFGPDYHFISAPPGTHTWRVDTYSQNFVPPGGVPGGSPQLLRGRDVVQTTPDNTCGGGGTPPPAVETCGDGIDNNGNGLVDENCQPQAITLNQPQAVCSGTSSQIGLSWSSTVTQGREQHLAARSDTAFGEALRRAKVATVGDPGPPLPPSSGPITYTVLRDGQGIGSTTQTSFTDTSPLPGSHSYSIFAMNSSFTMIQSNAQSVATPSCGAPPVQGIQVSVSGPATVLLGQSYTYTVTVTDTLTGQPVAVPAGAVQWSLFRGDCRMMPGNCSGDIRSSGSNPSEVMLDTTNNCLQAQASDSVIAVVTMTIAGQLVSSTGSQAFSFNDNPCSPPPPPPPPSGGSSSVSATITGDDDLDRNTSYLYTATVTNTVTGLPIQISANMGGSVPVETRLDFEDAIGPISGSRYPNLLITSSGDPQAVIYKPDNPNCPDYVAPSAERALYNAHPGGNSPLVLSFTNNQVSDRVTMTVGHFSTAGVVTVESLDSSGAVIEQYALQPVVNTCLKTSIALSRGSSSGIASVRIAGQAGGTGFWDVDNFTYSLPTPIPENSAVIDQWFLDNSNPSSPLGNQPTSSGLDSATVQTLGNHGAQGRLLVSGRANVGGVIVRFVGEKFLSINDPGLPSILGDIFGRGDVGQLVVDERAVVSSNSNVVVTRSTQPNGQGGRIQNRDIQRYVPSSTLELGSQSTIDAQIERLRRERATRLPTGALQQGIFDLSRPGTSGLEAGVWYTPDDVVIQLPIQFTGSGTIITDGSVRIEGAGAMQAWTGMLGVIARQGDIVFAGTDSAATIFGAYFAPRGRIEFQSGVGVAQGLFVGNEVTIRASLLGLRIQYDGRVALSPPPGFRQSVLPVVGESAP